VGSGRGKPREWTKVEERCSSGHTSETRLELSGVKIKKAGQKGEKRSWQIYEKQAVTDRATKTASHVGADKERRGEGHGKGSKAGVVGGRLGLYMVERHADELGVPEKGLL